MGNYFPRQEPHEGYFQKPSTVCEEMRKKLLGHAWKLEAIDNEKNGRGSLPQDSFMERGKAYIYLRGRRSLGWYIDNFSRVPTGYNEDEGKEK